MKRNILLGVTIVFVLTTFLSFKLGKRSDKLSPYLSPGSVVVDEANGIAYTALTTHQAIAVTRLHQKETIDRIELKQNPNHLLLSPDGKLLFVTCGVARGVVDIFKVPAGKRITSVRVGHTPVGMALSTDGKQLYVTNRFDNNVSVIDMVTKKVKQVIPVAREPKAVSLSPDGNMLAVAGCLPEQASNSGWVASQISLINLHDGTVKNVILDNGAQSVEGVVFSPDGHYLYAIHTLSQYNALITQLERGWVNTSALSIVDVTDQTVYAAVLLDDMNKGAASPSALWLDDNRLYITLAGSDELMLVDLHQLHKKLSRRFSALKTNKNQDKAELLTSLTFMTELKQRISLQGRSPRSVVGYDGQILVSSRFSTALDVVSFDSCCSVKKISLGNEPVPDAIRRGESAFCDATLCFQQWQSCASCHPDGRSDGLNWDQMNDGAGNPKNTKSLLYSHVTPPCMITAIRDNAELAVRKGIIHTLMARQSEQTAHDIDEYLNAMRPLESPFAAEYKLKDPKQLGKALFESAGCKNCHNGQYFTDCQSYDVGTGDGAYKNVPFDTPSLCEVWRTAPYLYDGRAVTLEEVLTKYNKKGLHGSTLNLSKDELAALILYVKTL